jgi:hypothetical protein
MHGIVFTQRSTQQLQIFRIQAHRKCQLLIHFQQCRFNQAADRATGKLQLAAYQLLGQMQGQALHRLEQSLGIGQGSLQALQYRTQLLHFLFGTGRSSGTTFGHALLPAHGTLTRHGTRQYLLAHQAVTSWYRGILGRSFVL